MEKQPILNNFDLHSYLESKDLMLAIHTNDDELMPVMRKKVSELKESFDKTDESVVKYLEWFENDLADVKGAIGTMKEKERLLNDQMKKLVSFLDSKLVRKDTNATVESSGSEDSIRQQQRRKKEVYKFVDTISMELKETLNLNPQFNLSSYVASKDEMLATHKIDDELMPAVMNHMSKLKSIPGTDDKDVQELDGLRNNLFDVRGTIGRLKEAERLLNDQMRDLVKVDFDDISYEMNATAKKKRRATLMDFMGSEAAEFFDWRDDLDSDSKKNGKSSKRTTINSDNIGEQIQRLHKTLPKLKETLNSTLRVSTTVLQSPSSSKISESIEGTNGGTPFSLDSSLHSTMPSLPAFKDFQILYGSLDNRSKLCLLCFSAFPDNSVINKRALIYWWIGEGFIESLDETAEKTADEIFQQLRSKGFIEPVCRKRFPVIHRYKMHPFIRLMVVILARNAGFFDIDPVGNFLTNPSKSLKACLVRSEQGSSQHVLRDLELKNLDTLFNVNESYLDLQSYWFSKLKAVRILQLGKWQSSTKHHIEVSNTDFLKSLSNMKYLRYLSLQGISRIPQLPGSFSNLADMRVLDLRACYNLQKLPHGIGMLKSLTHLDISECYLIDHMPQELASLTQLQVLKGFVIGDATSSKDGNVCKLTELSQRLTNLRKLSLYINGQADATKDELFTNLPKFVQLSSLTMTWVGVPQLSTPRSPPPERPKTLKPRKWRKVQREIEAVIALEHDHTTNNVNPFENLEKLDLRCFPWSQMRGPLAPNQLTSLKKLYIRGGELCNLKNMGNACKVEILRLKYLGKLGMSWEKLQASFPHLTYLEKVGCPNLNLFPCDGTGVWMKKRSDSYQG